MWKVRRMLVWISRIRHCRGFGIQSPWAYKLTCEVINGRAERPEYETLRLSHPTTDVVSRKLRELALRLSDYKRPTHIVNVADADIAMADYLRAGCSEARYEEASSEAEIGSFGAVVETAADGLLARVAAGERADKAMETLTGRARSGAVIMLEGIHADATARRWWRRVLAETPRVVTFDLYYCGLIFFDDKRYKQNYIINF